MAASNGALRDGRRRGADQADLQGRNLLTRVNGMRPMTIEVSKRTGANLIETWMMWKKTIEALRARDGLKPFR